MATVFKLIFAWTHFVKIYFHARIENVRLYPEQKKVLHEIA